MQLTQTRQCRCTSSTLVSQLCHRSVPLQGLRDAFAQSFGMKMTRVSTQVHQMVSLRTGTSKRVLRMPSLKYSLNQGIRLAPSALACTATISMFMWLAVHSMPATAISACTRSRCPPKRTRIKIIDQLKDKRNQ